MTALFRRDGLRPLLRAGIHPTDWNGLRRLCVDYFPTSATRRQLMTSLSMIAKLVNEASIPARLWIGGDFLTEREDPRECSVVFILVESVYKTLSADQLDFFEWFRHSSLLEEHRCETYGMVLDAGRDDWETLYSYWLIQFGLGKASSRPGIVEILTPSLFNL